MDLKKSRQILLCMVLIMSIPALLQAQYKREVPTIPGLTRNSSTGSASILGIDLSKIDFQNSYSMQVNSFGGNTVAMGLLKSSFNYSINPQVSVKGYVGLVHSPFSSMAPMNEQSSLMSGLDKDNILYGGEITYRPTENMMFHIGINRLPVQAQSQFYSPYNYRMLGY